METEADSEGQSGGSWTVIDTLRAELLNESINAIRVSIKSIKAVSRGDDKNIKSKLESVEDLINNYAIYAETIAKTRRNKSFLQNFILTSIDVKEIVAKTIDDITDVVTDAITEDGSDDDIEEVGNNTETEPIKTPSLKPNLVLARHVEDDIKNVESNKEPGEPNGMFDPETKDEAIKAPSLSSMIMEWGGDSNPEPHLINEILRCKEEDMYEMYCQSQNRYMLKQKFPRLLNKAKSDCKEKRLVLMRKFEAFHAAPTQEPTESIKAPSLNDMVINEVMEWEHGSSPEPHLINKIVRCEKLYREVRSSLQSTISMLTNKLEAFYEVSAQEIQDDTKSIESDTEPEKPSGIFEVKEIVANTIDDITAVSYTHLPSPRDS